MAEKKKVDNTNVVEKKEVEYRYKRIVFTDDQLREKGVELARATDAVRSLDAELATFRDQIKAKISQKEATAGVLRGHLLNGFETVMVPCRVLVDFVANERQYIDKETGELVDTAPLEPSDRQMELTS